MTLTFNGYRRVDGTVGVRNYLAIIPSVFCANRTVERIAAQLPGAVPLRHAVGCSQVGLDLELTARTHPSQRGRRDRGRPWLRALSPTGT